MPITIPNPIRSTLKPSQVSQSATSSPGRAPQPLAKRDLFESAFIGQRRTVVSAPMTVAVPVDLNLTPTQSTARFSLPATAFLGDPSTIASVGLGKPWTTGDVSFKVDGGQVRFEVPSADANAFAEIAPPLQVTYADGRSELLEVSSDTISVDDSAHEKAMLEQNVDTDARIVAGYSDELAKLEAAPIKPEHQDALDAATKQLADSKAALDAARPAVVAKVMAADDLTLMRMAGYAGGDLDTLAEAFTTAHNTAIDGTDAQKAAAAAAGEALRSALVSSDAHLAMADTATAPAPFAKAFDTLKEATADMATLPGIVKGEVAQNAELRDRAIQENNGSLAEWQGRLEANRKALASFTGHTWSAAVKQIIP